MHEMGICQGILTSSIEAAEKADATKIREIRISVGELTEIVEYALQFAFETLSVGTLAEGGELIVNIIKPASRCTQCGTEFEHGVFDAQCPECGNPFNETIRGRELQIDSIDVDTPDSDSDTIGTKTDTKDTETGGE